MPLSTIAASNPMAEVIRGCCYRHLGSIKAGCLQPSDKEWRRFYLFLVEERRKSSGSPRTSRGREKSQLVAVVGMGRAGCV